MGVSVCENKIRSIFNLEIFVFEIRNNQKQLSASSLTKLKQNANLSCQKYWCSMNGGFLMADISDLLTLPKGLLAPADDISALAARYRTRAVPETVTDEILGGWYSNLDALAPVTSGVRWPDSTCHSINGSSCWPTWVIHHNPSDLPDTQFVARLLVFGNPTPITIMGDTLEAVRDLLPPGLRRYGRSTGDRDTIVESWQAF